MKVLLSILLFGLIYVPNLSAAQQEPKYMYENFQEVDYKQNEKLRKVKKKSRIKKNKRARTYDPQSEFRRASLFSWLSVVAASITIFMASSGGFAILALLAIGFYVASLGISIKVLRYVKKHEPKLLRKARLRFIWVLIAPWIIWSLVGTIYLLSWF
ncbi:MAG: hypothetical protein R8P61_00255 [Bacteroidia bacterium]|nr:hypothetical protein [Bacteroidia bacterium]